MKKKEKKKKIIKYIVIFLFLLVLFFPIKLQYKDGGTIEYKSLTYKIIKWHRIKNYGRYKTGTDFILFPNNFKPLDYYDQDIEPPMFGALTKENNQKYIMCNQATYHWSKTIGKEKQYIIVDTTDPIEFTYEDKFTIKNTEKIYLDNQINIKEITIKNLNDLENNYNITYLYEEQAFVFDDLQEGEYVVVFKYTEEENYAYYSYKVEIIKE